MDGELGGNGNRNGENGWERGISVNQSNQSIDR